MFVKGCVVCQSTKAITNLVSIPIIPIIMELYKPWESISYDYITDLPESNEYNAIYVVIDYKCSKGAVFIPCKKEIDTIRNAQLYFNNVFRKYGLSKRMISDRGPLFMSKIAKELFKLIGVKQLFSTAYHPQIDGETERVNRELELYLRTFCGLHQHDWAKWITMAEFCYNNRPHSTIGKSPFKVMMRFNPNVLIVGNKPYSSPTVEERLEGLKEIRKEIEASQQLANEVIKEQSMENTDIFKIGEKVSLNGKNITMNNPSIKLSPKTYGLFKITEQINPVTYKLKLPKNMKIWPVFHAGLLYPYKETEEYGPNYALSPPTIVDNKEEWIVETIVNAKIDYGKVKYQIKWEEYPELENTWEPLSNVRHMWEEIQEFHSRNPLAPIPVSKNNTTPVKGNSYSGNKRRKKVKRT